MARKNQPKKRINRTTTSRGSKTNQNSKKVVADAKTKKTTATDLRTAKTWRDVVRITLKNGGTMQEASKYWKTKNK